MEKYSLILLDISGSITEENRLNYLKHLPAVARFCIPQSPDQYNVLLTPLNDRWGEEEMLQSQSEEQYLGSISQVSASMKYGMGGSAMIDNIKKTINYANEKNIEIEKIFILTDGYDDMGNRKSFEEELKLNPNLNLTLVMEKVFFDQHPQSHKSTDWMTNVCMDDLALKEAIVNEKMSLQKTIITPKVKKRSSKTKKELKIEIKI